MNKRDLKADLELIESMNKHFVEESGDFVREEILPHALKRAIAAEEEVERLKKQLQASRDSVYGISCEADEARCERNELKVQVERLSKVIGSQKFEIDALDLEIEYLEEETKKVERLQALLQDSLKTMQEAVNDIDCEYPQTARIGLEKAIQRIQEGMENE